MLMARRHLRSWIPNMKNNYLLTGILVLLILIGVAARLYQFGQIPHSLYWDEVAIGLDARSLLQTGQDLSGKSWLQPLFYSYGDYKAPVYIWLAALFGRIGGVTEGIVRLPNLLASFGLGALLFFLSNKVKERKSALGCFVVVNFLLMPWAFHFSRIGMESFLSLFWVTLMVYLEIVGLKRNKGWFVALAALAGVVGIYTYIAARIMVVGLYLGVLGIFAWGKGKQQWLGMVVGLAVIGLSVGILVNSPDYAASQNYRLSNDNLIRTTIHVEQSVAAQGQERSLVSRLVYHRYWFWSQHYLINYLIHFGPDFLFFTGDINLRHHSGFGGQILLVQGLLLIIGFIIIARSFQKMDGLMLLWLFLAPSVAALVNEVPHASRAIYMIVPLSWFVGRGLAGIVERKKTSVLVVGLIALLLVNFGVYLHDYFVHYPQRSQLAWMMPYKQVAQFFLTQESAEPVFVTDQWYQPGLYWAFYQEVPAEKLQQTQGNYLKALGRFTFHLPQDCPQGSWCVAPPDWQTATTRVLSLILNTSDLVVKVVK